jgi:hypothetical protein
MAPAAAPVTTFAMRLLIFYSPFKSPGKIKRGQSGELAKEGDPANS